MDAENSSTVGLPTVEKYYSTGSVIAALIISTVAAVILSWVYGPAVHYCPFIYLNAILAFGMGWLVGKVARSVIKARKINRTRTATLIGLVAGLIGLYFSWLSFIFVIADFRFDVYVEFLVRPWDVLTLAQNLAHSPFWTFLTSGPLPAVVYYLVWLVEAVLVAGVPAIMCRDFVRDNLLCDGCGEWVVPTGDVALFTLEEDAPTSTEAVTPLEPTRPVVQRLMAQDLDALFELPRAIAPSLGQRIEVIGLACPGCEDRDGYVSVYRVVEKEEKKKKKHEISSAPLALNVPVSVAMEKAIFEPAERLAAAAAAEPEGEAPDETPVEE